ncbi:MAG: type II toxin-antitoxin system HicB family antitoxin [Chloroflexi bacterium]|nr:type II toxin-antitoxin system HicB family antitoxin [Chloroflexota bacterium]
MRPVTVPSHRRLRKVLVLAILRQHDAGAERQLMSAVDELLRAPFARVLVPVEEGGFVAQVLELEGCFAQGDTPDEAMAELQGAMRDWLDAAIAAGQSIPTPLGLKEYSGRLVLRIPPTLHERAAQRAALEHVSLNQLLLTAVAMYLGALADAPAPQSDGRTAASA